MDLLIGRAVKRGVAFAMVFSGLLLSGCSNVVYKVTGDTMINYGQDKMIPYLLSTDDTKIGCVAGEALTPLLLSFGTVTSPPDDLAVLIYMVNGACATNRAVDLELDYLRLSKDHLITQAQDARIHAKRWHGIAAKRLLKGYEALVRSMGEIGNECPNFASDQQQMIWLLGTAVGLQAVMADAQSGLVAGVPRDIAPKAERAAACLDNAEGNRRWWGLPKAIRATLWTVVPGITPDGMDPWKELNVAMRIGEEEGVRIADGLASMASYNDSNFELTKSIIRKHAKSLQTIASSREFQLVDIMATDMIYALSDRLWTEAEGHRTPSGQLGTFWDDKKDEPKLEIDIDDLL